MSFEYLLGKKNKFLHVRSTVEPTLWKAACRAFAPGREAFVFVKAQDDGACNCASLLLTARWHSHAAACSAWATMEIALRWTPIMGAIRSWVFGGVAPSQRSRARNGHRGQVNMNERCAGLGQHIVPHHVDGLQGAAPRTPGRRALAAIGLTGAVLRASNLLPHRREFTRVYVNPALYSSSTSNTEHVRDSRARDSRW
jgi:hypothetical protein